MSLTRMQAFHITFMGVCLFTLGGCVIPFPSTTEIAPAIQGRVLESGSKRPVADALIEHLYDEQIRRQSKTDSDGKFTVKPLRQHHWGYLFLVALNHQLPHPKLFSGEPVTTTLRVISLGYRNFETQLNLGWQDKESETIPTDPRNVEVRLKRWSDDG